MREVPSGWRYDRFDEFLVLQRGFDLTQKDAQAGNVPVVSSSGVSYYHNVAQVQPPGVVTGRKGKLGQVYLITVPFWPHDTTLWVKDFKGNDPEFTKLFLQSLNLGRFDAATSVPTLNRNNVHKLMVAFPPLPEQRAIAAILGTWDRAITLTEQRLAAAEQRKKALMQQLLTGRVRFPEFVKSTEMQKTRYGDLPADWGIVHLETVAKVNAKSLKESSEPNQEYLYIDLSSVDRGTIAMPTEHQRFSELPSRARRVLSRGDVIMATVRPNLLGFAVCDFEPENVLCSTGFALISPKDLSDSQFIYQSLYSDTIVRQVHGLVTGSNYPAINASEVKKLWFFWPKSVEERVRTAAVLNACDRELDLRRRKRDALQAQKKGLMQRLLTGRVRVGPGLKPQGQTHEGP